MNKEGRFQNVLIILLAVAVVGMSIGFAAFSSQLTITGNATFEKAKWEVIWENNTVAETETNATDQGTVVVDSNNMNVTYNVTLKPHTEYSFTVYAKNNGTFDAKLTGITFTGKTPAQITSEHSGKIGYTFTYAGTPYTQTTDLSGENITLAKNGGRVPVVVTLTYPLPESASNLLANDVNVSLGVQLNYEPVIENN
jgi:hypothetical protein